MSRFTESQVLDHDFGDNEGEDTEQHSIASRMSRFLRRKTMCSITSLAHASSRVCSLNTVPLTIQPSGHMSVGIKNLAVSFVMR